MPNKAITLKNAPHWLNHSTVSLKGLFLASDEAYVTNNIVSVQGAGTDGATVQTMAGDATLLKIGRMVTEGTVAVMLRDGSTYQVELPLEAENLLPTDAAYIAGEIDAISKPMDAKEQADFLKSANAPSKTPLSVAS